MHWSMSRMLSCTACCTSAPPWSGVDSCATALSSASNTDSDFVDGVVWKSSPSAGAPLIANDMPSTLMSWPLVNALPVDDRRCRP